MIISAYGAVTENIRWKTDVDKLLYDMSSDEIKKEFQEKLDMEEYMPDDFFEFALDYENDLYLWNGIEAVIVDTINDKEFEGKPVFRFEDQCIYVEPRIPVDEEDRKMIPTQQQIQGILSKYLNPLIGKPVIVDWCQLPTA